MACPASGTDAGDAESLSIFHPRGDYQMGRGGTVRWIDSSRLVMFGSRSLGDLGDGTIISTAVMANGRARIWVGRCSLAATRALYAPDTNSAIYFAESKVTGSAIGNVIPFEL